MGRSYFSRTKSNIGANDCKKRRPWLESYSASNVQWWWNATLWEYQKYTKKGWALLRSGSTYCYIVDKKLEEVLFFENGVGRPAA